MSGSDYEAGDINTIAGGQVEDDIEDEPEDYEDGDVNAVREDSEPDVDDMVGNRSDESTPVAVLTYLAKSLSDEPEAVVIEAEHLCMAMRGVRKPGARTVTSAVRGSFRDNDSTRAEAMSLLVSRQGG